MNPSKIIEDHPSTLYSTNPKIIHRLVLTGGPCGGKTTGQSRLSTFFENLGWKVFRVPETATLLMSGGVKWTDLSAEQADRFQQNLIKTMMQIEQTYFDLAEMSNTNALVICDRGVMDPSAYMPIESWDKLISREKWTNVELRDSRYSQVIHMTTAALGAEEFYTTEEHVVRHEGPELARTLDHKTAQAWVGHPYYDVIDNSTDFNKKCMRMMAAVCQKIGIDVADRLELNSKKHKFLISDFKEEQFWPSYKEFDVVHDYLVTPNNKMQARLRKRGQNGVFTFTHTVRRPKIKGQRVELRKQISGRTYQLLLNQRDQKTYTIFKKRRCFLFNNKYYQLDIYREPCHPRCKGLMILETYTTATDAEITIPDFLTSECEVTEQPLYSMYNLSHKDYHAMEVTAGATRSPVEFDYRQVYAEVEAGTKESGIEMNGFH